ncbi:piwi-like protein 1 isoform X3 [Canis lupus baileyi]|uniref:piwi-like protein 1 isoform X3 n=1 Tax=Canis lupus familiaris TaxID=9615 RepID=UPI000BAA205D|nr:piwi-like protein 1 isoform X3 [Canis lupus familiaris]XP_025329367.3 piwi-like protein 1 isoform X3 [Canis lupus dingo]XP_038292266.1 piwi-like protein 1 isoform X3 [Canis lupus familiaris]XP_038430660.1 piwi-like protein 1 isoform X3 [Canis lupus familiaris]|eukprot:XP_022266183.1 piwi-like protein 1 isoform X3 [Canis lupus familiaris]
MTGRARARARGRARGQETVQHVGATVSQQPGYVQPRPQQPVAEGELVGRGRQRGAVGAAAKSQELQISAGFQELSLAERGGRRRDFHDLGVNTRQNLDHVKESKTGSSGIIVRLSTNHFRLTSRPQWALYQYHIDYNPLMEARRLRSALLFQHEDLIGRCHAFDGTILFLPKRLQHKVTEVFSQTRNGEHVRITITLTNELPPTSPTCLQFYNIIFRRLLKIMNLQQIGRNYYNPSDPIDIPNHRYNNKTYRVDDIDWDQNPKSTFKKADGSEVSFLEYYRKQYNQEITDLKQPVLVSQPKRRRGPGGTLPGPAMLIPELCYLTGLTDKMRNDFNVMKDLAVHTRLTPEQRQREVGRLIDYIHKDDNVQRELRDWGLSFDSNLLSFSGRILQAEKIHQGGKTFDYNPQFADWSKETRGAPLISVKPLDNWLLIYTRRNYEAANSLIQNLFKVTPAMGIQMKKAIMIEVDDRTEAYLRVLQQKVTSDTQIVVCLLSSNRKDKYDAIKKYLCTDCPTPSQCVVARTLGKQQTVMAIATKIALQMNCKMGGELWRVDMPLKLAMIVGIDCYHDTTAGRRSIAGFVASINEGMTRWFSRCVFQDRGQELVDGLKVCLQAALRAWNSCNEYMPSRIIVYRDGVGDGQLKTLVNYEVPQFLDCLKSVGRGYNPRLTVIVVKKRVNARFFAQSGGRLQNPLPGTVIDVEVTRPEWYDFFIVSQAVRSGSVSPTHYNVIYDSSGLKPDHIQRLTYKLCHVYYNWPGVIRVPAPCQYAHKLAFLVGQSIHREPNLSLSNRLYYL